MVYSVVDGEFRAPQTAIELEQHCQRQEVAEVCVRKRNENCTSGVLKGIGRFMMDAIHDEREIRCDPSTPEHDKYLAMAPCLNSLSQHTLQCMKILARDTDVFATAAVGRTLKQKIPHGCCIYNAFVSCVVDETKRVCGEEAGVFHEQLTSGAVGELITSACDPYKTERVQCKAFTDLTPSADSVDNSGFAFLGTIAKLSDALRNKRS